MRYTEICPCGAELRIESHIPLSDTIQNWRDNHRCVIQKKRRASVRFNPEPNISDYVTDSSLPDWVMEQIAK